jgi:hypothetical protein
MAFFLVRAIVAFVPHVGYAQRQRCGFQEHFMPTHPQHLQPPSPSAG